MCMNPNCWIINSYDDHNKLRTYNKLKRDMGVEIYLQIIPDIRISKNGKTAESPTNIFDICLINELWYLIGVWGLAPNINVNLY